MPTPSSKNTCAIIVTYHPGDYFISNLSKIITQVDNVFIIDNGSALPSLEMLKNLPCEAKVTFNQQNTGVASALNQGMTLAIAGQYDWCLLLDQDSAVDNDIISAFQETYNAISDKNVIGIISAHFISPTKIRFNNKKENNKTFIEKKICMTSGSLLSVNAYQKTGKFKDDFFIDLIDTEYCLRLRAGGYKIYATITPLMVHEIGQPTRHTLLGVSINASNHPPFRRYYMARNFILLTKLYVSTEPVQILTQAKILLIDFIVILFFEDFKKIKLLAIMNGIKDGLFNNPPKKTERFSG